MLRSSIASRLRADTSLQALLPGGIFPNGDEQASSMSKEDFPTAFDDKGEIIPCCLVQDDGSFSVPNLSQGVSATFRIFVWQQRGRETIDAALVRFRFVLKPLTLQVGSLYVYELQWAGDGPNLRDQALDDAEFGWSRWQSVSIE
jgi:hypothetical protein